MANPFLFVVGQMAVFFLSVLAVFIVGRAFGGTGGFDDALQLMLWLQFVMLLFAIVELPISLMGQQISGVFDMVSAFYVTWMTVHFITVLHGFRSLWLVFAGLMGVSILIGFVLIMLLGASGTVQGV